MSNISRVFSAELDGIDARLIEVETDIHTGLHSFTIVGLADKALTEAKERVSAALKNIGVKPPTKENRRIVVNLAPADIKKTGSQYDLAIAIGYLLATRQLKPFDSGKTIFVGELSLEGKLRPINGALSIADLARKTGFDTLILPEENSSEAAMVQGINVVPVKDLGSLMRHLENKDRIPSKIATQIEPRDEASITDISEIKGQEAAKRALMIAASGGHNILMQGPPGTGKTMLAQAFASILPPLETEEIIEITKIYSAAGLLGSLPYVANRPFRSPHQGASTPAVVGGGQTPRPGEISLAHRGVLFLDELPEFKRDLLEALRQPLESGKAFVSRVKGTLTLPARFTLVAAMNPCPCGYYGDEEKPCRCGAYEVVRYQKKISGPLLDRIDIQIDVPRVKLQELVDKRSTNREMLISLRKKVAAAREIQRERLKNLKGKFTNAELTAKECDDLVFLDQGATDFMGNVFEKSLVSARGYYRVIKVAQTIADLEESESVKAEHLAEAFGYRLREKE